MQAHKRPICFRVYILFQECIRRLFLLPRQVDLRLPRLHPDACRCKRAGMELGGRPAHAVIAHTQRIESPAPAAVRPYTCFRPTDPAQQRAARIAEEIDHKIELPPPKKESDTQLFKERSP